jgi:aldose sugar dehydrogenase
VLKAGQVLKFFGIRKLLLAAGVLIVLTITFSAGAIFYRHQVWPFGQGYYAKVVALGLLPQRVEEIEITRQTAYHKLKLFYFREVPIGQLALLRSTATNLTLIHVSEAGDVSRLKVSLSDPNLQPEISIETAGKLSGLFTEAYGKVNDVFITRDRSVLVSYTTADYRKCASLNLDKIIFTESFSAFSQTTLYQTRPCTLPPYLLHQTGGRIVEHSNGDIFLSVGDFGRKDKVLRDDTDFGKILKFSGETMSELARGFRNPQGLFFDFESNRLYCTDHGPVGGDEINTVEAGKNYGWPLDTYGFNYPEEQPFSEGLVTYGKHDRYVPPLFAFVPDIGIGQISKMPTDSYEFQIGQGISLLLA